MPNADTPSRSLFPRLQRAIFPDMVSNFEVEYIAGGATQNSARVAQWMLGEAGSVTYIGCVGKDEFAAKVRALWRGLKGGGETSLVDRVRSPHGRRLIEWPRCWLLEALRVC